MFTIEQIVRAHRDFVTSTHVHELGVCLRDGCGSANFYGPAAWEEAAKHLGLSLPERTTGKYRMFSGNTHSGREFNDVCDAMSAADQQIALSIALFAVIVRVSDAKQVYAKTRHGTCYGVDSMEQRDGKGPYMDARIARCTHEGEPLDDYCEQCGAFNKDPRSMEERDYEVMLSCTWHGSVNHVKPAEHVRIMEGLGNA